MGYLSKSWFFTGNFCFSHSKPELFKMQIKVLSRNPKLYSTKRLVEAARERNHEISVINPLNCDLIIKKRDPNIFYKGKKIENVDAIIPRIGVSDTFYGAAVIRQFELMKVFSTVGSLALNRSRDRLRSLLLLSAANLGLPKTAISNDSHNLSGILNFVDDAPLIIKLLERKQGLGVVLAETNNAAISVLEAFKGLKVRVIFQKYIKESSGSDVRAFVVDGRVVGAMKRQAKKGEFRSNLNLGGTTQNIELTDEEERCALKAARIMKMGVCGVDMLQSADGPLILKVSPCPGLKQIESVTKKDIAKVIIRYIEKNI